MWRKRSIRSKEHSVRHEVEIPLLQLQRPYYERMQFSCSFKCYSFSEYSSDPSIHCRIHESLKTNMKYAKTFLQAFHRLVVRKPGRTKRGRVFLSSFLKLLDGNRLKPTRGTGRSNEDNFMFLSKKSCYNFDIPIALAVKITYTDNA